MWRQGLLLFGCFGLHVLLFGLMICSGFVVSNGCCIHQGGHCVAVKAERGKALSVKFSVRAGDSIHGQGHAYHHSFKSTLW